LNMLGWNIYELEHKRSQTIEEILKEEGHAQGTANWNNSLARVMLIQDPKTPALTRDPDGSVGLRDPWGNLLEVHTRTEAVKLNIAGAMLERSNSIVIWSRGPNAKNEYGRGDDVVSTVY